MIYPVGYDGLISAVEANTKNEAENKIKQYIHDVGLKISNITVYEPSDGYNEWIQTWNIEVVK